MAGSFVRKDDIVNSIQAKKGAQVKPAPQEPKNIENTAQEAPNSENAKDSGGVVSDLIEKQLPESVGTAFGTVSYENFKKLFSDVYEQVADKHNLLSGRVTHTFKVGKMNVTFRSLKNKERTALLNYAGNPKTDDLSKFSIDDAEYRKKFLTVSIKSIDEIQFPDVTLTLDTIDSWEQHKLVMDAFDFIENLDDSFVALLYNLAIDLMTAKQYALIENLKNQ